MVASEIRNSVLKKLRGIDQERVLFYTEKSAPFADFCVSQNSPLRSAERNGTDFLLKMRFYRTAKNNNNRKSFYRSKASCFGMSFQKFFLLLSSSKPNYSVFLFGRELRAFLSSEEGSEQNYKVPHVISSPKWFGTEL